MNKIFSVFVVALLFALPVFSNEINEVEKFFDEYVAAANSYSNNYFSYYIDDAKIVRVVEKPDGTCQSVDIPFERYKVEAKKSSKFARLRKYKNKYFNVKILPSGDDYKITAMRMPSTSDYKIPAHFIIGKDDNGNWKIKEESMNTKVQRFLKES